MEPTVRLALLCDYALRSQDGKLSAIGIFSSVGMAEIPGPSPPFFVVISVGLDRGTHPVSLGIVDPLGQQVLPEQPAFDVEVEAPGMDTELLFQFNGLPLPRPGIYQIQLFVEGRLVHSMPLSVQGASGQMPGRA
ncbi:MAG TPA: hypothetical protein VFB58_08765 [Chloroflexota bacterium]|nr:hypothetical protein [Chloroflexota bacterium]